MNLLDNLAFVYERKTDFESAIEVRRLQLDLEKRNWRIYYFLALDLNKLGRKEEAKRILLEIKSLYKYMDSSEKKVYAEAVQELGK